jgi:hypothetical protein
MVEIKVIRLASFHLLGDCLLQVDAMKITEVVQIFSQLLTSLKLYIFSTKTRWTKLWAIFTQTHLVTLLITFPNEASVLRIQFDQIGLLFAC